MARSRTANPTPVYRPTNADVKRAVAGNRNTPVETLKRLAKDSDPEVRQAVAWNDRTPVSVLDMLAGETKGVKAMAKTKYDGGTMGPPMRKASSSGKKGYPEKGKPVKTGKPSRTMY